MPSPALGRQLRARWNEARLYLASHPLAFLLIEFLARFGRVVRVPGLGVVVTDLSLIRAIFGDDESFSKTGAGSAGVFYDQVMGGRALFNMDGSAHLQLRRRVGDVFAPSYLKVVASEVLIEPLADLDRRLRAGEVVDLVPFVHSMTGRMMCHQLGIQPAIGREESTFMDLYALGEELISPLRLTTRRLSAAQLSHSRALYRRLVAPARVSFEIDGSSTSIVARLKAAGLGLDEVEGVLGALFLAGTQTVSSSLPRLVALLSDSGQGALLRARRDLLHGAVNEGFRYTVPTPITLRRVRHDVDVMGVRFRAAERVVVATYHAARDEVEFPSPRLFDIQRSLPVAARQTWFGAGQHFCLGYALAHLELNSVLQTLFALPGEIEVVGRRPARQVLIPAYASLRVRLELDVP